VILVKMPLHNMSTYDYVTSHDSRTFQRTL